MYGAGDMRVGEVPAPRIVEPTDAVVCGSDLPHRCTPASDEGVPMGAECLGGVEETGPEAMQPKQGDFVMGLDPTHCTKGWPSG
nr:alcohol dehydrogenase catalytic domain-containing protein [Streptomyces sp. Ncost-T10-10d]